MATLSIPQAPSAPAPTAFAGGTQKLIHLQILRALAASLVVLDHTFGSLQFRGITYGNSIATGDSLGNFGVCAFFVLSGLIMVRQSGGRFGDPRSPLLFLYHRILRIVPLYWIATALWFYSLKTWHIPTIHASTQILSSLFFIPNYLAQDYRVSPILSQGWTLNFEMSFYALFAAALFLPRKFGISLLLLVPLVLTRIGFNHPLELPHTVASIGLFYTDGIVILFAAGVLVGFLEMKWKRLRKFDCSVSPALLLLLPALWLFSGHAGPHALDRFENFKYLFSIAIVALCALDVNARVGWVNRVLALLGDASYSTYLFHLWVYQWTIPAVIALYARLHRGLPPAMAFILAAVLAANILGLVIHLILERPITKALRNLKGTVLTYRA